MSSSGWIGVDLDGTLAYYDGWQYGGAIGEPVPLMLLRVKKWLKEGKEVRIVTARADKDYYVQLIYAWCEKHLGTRLAVTNTKDFQMIELWDDRCVQVIRNTGKRADGADQIPKVCPKCKGEKVVADTTPYTVIPAGIQTCPFCDGTGLDPNLATRVATTD